MEARKKYVPERGHLIWLSFIPQRGHEQAGKRPALVLSPVEYNSKTNLAICCPITRQVKGYPFETVLPESLPVGGAILSDHVKCLDWKERRATFIESISLEIVLPQQNLWVTSGTGRFPSL